MIVKLIEVRVKQGLLAEYLESQRIWNSETRRSPGLMGMFTGQSREDPETVWLLFFWRSRPDYEDWMATEHDQIAEKAGARERYESCRVRILEAILDAPDLLPFGLAPGGTQEAADIQLWSEAYRATYVLRTALRLALFDSLGTAERTSAELAAELSADPNQMERLCLALAGMQLLEPSGDRWRNTELALRTLRKSSPAYQGDMVLYNSRPQLVEYWSKLGERLGLPADVPPQDKQADIDQFLAAMGSTAGGGQAEALAEAVDLGDCRMLLDVGGGGGHYSIALCRAWPELRCTVLDLPQSEPMALRLVQAAGLGDRIRFLAGDYRAGEFPAGLGAVLISNVLRGEPLHSVRDILARAWRALPAGGQLIVTDEFPERPPAPMDLRQGLFFLHVPDGALLALEEMAAEVRMAGFESVRAERFPRWVTLNGIVVGRRK